MYEFCGPLRQINKKRMRCISAEKACRQRESPGSSPDGHRGYMPECHILNPTCWLSAMHAVI